MNNQQIKLFFSNLVAKTWRATCFVFKKCRIYLLILLVTFTILFSLFRALTPWVKQYKGEVEQQLSSLLGQPVTINDLETSWYWFHPVLKMEDVTISDPSAHVLKLNKLLVGINVLSSIWHWQIKPGILYVDDVHLTIRQINTHWEIDGLKSNQETMQLDENSTLPLFVGLLSQDTIIVKHVSASVHLNTDKVLSFDTINLKVSNSYGHLRFHGFAELDQAIKTKIALIGDLEIEPDALTKPKGQVYISLENFLPSEWQGFMPNSPYHIVRGEANARIWIDLFHGHVTKLQSTLMLSDLAWIEDGRSKTRQIEHLSGNFAWSATRSGWKFSADKFNLQENGTKWPENALVFEFRKKTNSYRGFVKKILLSPLLAADISWPEKLTPFLSVHPVGELNDTQIEIHNHQLDYVLTRFVELGWQNIDEIPAVSHISGVLYWQPTEGRLELDGENTVVAPAGQKPLTFGLFNAAFDWKELSNGLRITMDRFVLSHPLIVLSASGALDNATTLSAGNLRFNMEFAAKNASPLLAYIPSRYLKPKLNDWLKNDIKRIGHATGRIMVNGVLGDFPFDTTAGEFKIKAHVNGVNLLINPSWPINRDIDADILQDKRSFVATIYQANLRGVTVDKLNLAINDIGLGKEALLIHGNVDAKGEAVKSYVLASPLKTNLAKWKSLDIVDLINLELNLDVPLYPESDHVVAQGKISLQNNKMIIRLPLHPVVVDGLTGSIQFDEYGLTNGGLEGTVAGSPLSLNAELISQPKPYTAIKIEGDTSTDYLKSILPSSFYTYINGNLKVLSLWKMYHDNVTQDHLHLETSLQEVSIDLPEPFGKAYDTISPMSVDIDFKPKDNFNVLINYDNRTSCDLDFVTKNHKLTLQQGELLLGKGRPKKARKGDFNISGSLSTFNFSDWKKSLAKLGDDNENPSLFDNVTAVNLLVKNLALFGQHYQEVGFNARKVAADDWSFKLNQKNIMADLHYHPKAKQLSGTFENLLITKDDNKASKVKVTPMTIIPQEIPNLNVLVNNLRVGDVDVGQVNLVSTSSKNHWLLDSCSIKTPDYQLNLQGDWTQSLHKNTSTLQANLAINNLGKSLERWHITPAVQAHSGDVKFQGKWNAPFFDFAIARVDGNLQITFKDGRISHFDKETEEKLGLGKLLSILSLQTIPRRLKLDFSDLSEQGYSFDIFKGSFLLSKGVMTTHDSYIDGPVAYAKMDGDLDLSKHLYDVDLRITPYIMASLPVVVTIAGGPVAGPIAGVATWVASKIINKGMQKISGYTYKISGPWLSPVVQQVSIDKSLH